MNLGFLDVKDFVERTQGKSCLVVGDIILDKYIYGEVSRISPEAPIPVVKVTREQYVLGGAANVAGNIYGYHVKTYLCGVLGNDTNAEKVQKMLSERGIEFWGILSPRRCTTMKTRVIGMNQQLVRIDEEDVTIVDTEEEELLLEKLTQVLPQVQVVVLSDYNKGLCSEHFCNRLIAVCKEMEKAVIVDPKSSDWTKYMGAYLITPNFKEFQEAVGCEVKNTGTDISIHADTVMKQYHLNQLLVTRSRHGMTLIKENAEPVTFQSVQQEVYDVSGAGDTVVATIAAFLAIGIPLEKALEASNYAAGLAVSKAGTYMVTLEEVVEYVNHSVTWYEDKVWDMDQTYTMLQLWKKTNETIVFTNGCFDILHIGHMDYLNKAKMLGSKMIIGLNTDASVKRLKGASRPINNQKARALALAALQCVDAVVLFDEDTPEELIRIVQPDFLVKGGDYKLEEIVGSQYAKEVRTIPLTEGYSTTRILEKLQKG